MGALSCPLLPTSAYRQFPSSCSSRTIGREPAASEISHRSAKPASKLPRPFLTLIGGDAPHLPNYGFLSTVDLSNEPIFWGGWTMTKNLRMSRIAFVAICGLSGLLTEPPAALAAGCNSGNVANTDLLSGANCQANALGVNSLAVGNAANANGTGAVAVGNGAFANPFNGETAIGGNSLAGSTGATAVGSSADAQGVNTTVMGSSSFTGGAQTRRPSAQARNL
jgi:hypothetical protein